MNRIQLFWRFIRREDAERFIEVVRGDEAELARYRELRQPELEDALQLVYP